MRLEIEEYMDREMEELPLALAGPDRPHQDYATGINRYIGYLISIATHSFKGKKVGLDCANGAPLRGKERFRRPGSKYLCDQ